MSAESDYKCPKCGYEWCAIPPSECPKCSTHSSPPAGSARPGVNRISKYLRVVTEASLPGVRGVISNDGKLIAILGYYKAWRQWVMYPQPNTVWSEDCLQVIRNHLKQLGQVPNDQAHPTGGVKC